MPKGGRKKGSRDRAPRKMAPASLEALDAHRPAPSPYPSQVFRISAPRAALRWWSELKPHERTWWVAHAYAHRHLTGQDMVEEE